MRVTIVAQAGRLRDGLRVILDSIPDLETVAMVEDGPAALETIQSGQPDLVVLDSELVRDSAAAFVQGVKQERNGVRFLVVVDRLGQFQPFLDAGADRVLLKGFSAAELASAIKQLSNSVPD